jgi:hypothetical protein
VTELDLGDDDNGITDNSFEDDSLPDDLHGLAKLRMLNLSGLDCLTGKYKAQYFRYIQHPSQCGRQFVCPQGQFQTVFVSSTN